ncbi:MAG: hypothetical protein O2820_04905 [Planctomycetota bacterium]|nr:hypothetical protein [Planctomycetota bacterium]MDA1248543.1 hypothetical protein [Planctomycetota bacterium]
MLRFAFCVIAVLSTVVGVSENEAAGQGTENSASTKSRATVSPRTVRSRNFSMRTDLGDADSEELVEQLEKMLALISRYWGRPNQQTIEMFVVKDLKNWPAGSLDPDGLRSIEAKAGVTKHVKQTQGTRFRAKSVVFAVADRGTPQHEAVHAYCFQTFGETGPVWYSEGMAEMGQYWVENSAAVNCPPYIAEYIRSVEPKSLNEIVNGGREVTGDSWQNYAWRWALCHLLATNPNYSQRFRPLGLGILTGQRTSFEGVYGSMAKEISFEYRFFLDHVGVGFRADLCAWDWKSKYRIPRSTGTPVVASVSARGGWQPSRCVVKKDQEYDFMASGEWQSEEGSPLVSADGADDGRGKLVGAIFNDDTYAIGKPFELGAFGTWTAPADGQLVLRCQQPWTEINEEDAGKLSFRIKIAGAGKAFEDPRTATSPETKKP